MCWAREPAIRLSANCRVVGGGHVDGFGTGGEASDAGLAGGFLPGGVGSEGFPGFLGRGGAVVADDVDEGVLRGWFVGGVPVSDGLNAVAGEELDGVVAEAGVELSEFTFGGFVDAELEDGIGSRVRGVAPGRRVVGGLQENGLGRFGEDLAVLLGFGGGLFPLGVGDESFPGCFGGVAAFVFDNVDEGVFRFLVVGGNPVAEGFNAVFFEEGDGVVAEAGVEGVEFVFVGGVSAELEDVGEGWRGEGGEGDGSEEFGEVLFHRCSFGSLWRGKHKKLKANGHNYQRKSEFSPKQ